MIRAIGIAILAGVVLAACGGGAQTTQNVESGGGNDPSAGPPPYSGPGPKNDDVFAFQQSFWSNARGTDRCGGCHTPEGGQTPYFVRWDDVNLAYDEAVLKINREQPSESEFVARVSTGHGCWVADAGTCGTIMTTWIENWVGPGDVSGGRQIVLQAPEDNPPSDSRGFPDTAGGPPSFATMIWQPYLRAYCAGCHSTDGTLGNGIVMHSDTNVDVAYEAAKPKIDLDAPENSQLVVRVRQGHNSWTGDFNADADELEAAIRAYAEAIPLTSVDENLITSNEVTLLDGTIASGGNRYENDQIALWEFKTGVGNVAYDTSGVDPAIDLNFSGDVSWYGGWGITVGSDMASGGPGKAQAPTTTSRKLHDVLVESGEFSIEAWVIPANVTQEMRRIVSYSAGQNSRNFTLQQTLYNYDFLLRTNAEDAGGAPLTTLNGYPQLSTPDDAEVLQATLQHVVATYDPINGRRIYVNGVLETQVDPVPGGTLSTWDPNVAAFILGNEADSNSVFEGTFRLVAIHRRALALDQINQNFDAGVGERFYLLFNISEQIGLPAGSQIAYILFEAQQFDNFAYLFDKPHFLTLDGSDPGQIVMEGMRIAMNGQEALVGQSYANIVQTLDVSDPATLDELGQSLSPLGAVLPLEQGPEFDKFFLTFDNLDGTLFDRPEDPMLVRSDYIAAAEVASADIGMKTFDEIDATYAAITNVDRVSYQDGNGDFVVDETYQELRQSLPAVEDVEAFLSSHQVAIAQLAIQYCDAAVEANTIWPGFNFDAPRGTAFAAGAARNSFVEPLILRAVGHSSTSAQIGSQPSYAAVHEELASFAGLGDRPANLIDRLLGATTPPISDTRGIAKGVCASVLGSAATLVQ